MNTVNETLNGDSIVKIGIGGNIPISLIIPKMIGEVFTFNCVMCGQSFKGTSNDVISHSMLCTGF